MITLTEKEFDLLEQTAQHTATDAKPFKVVSVNNGSVAGLRSQGLIETRPKNGNPLMLELAITKLGYQVLNNEVEHEIGSNHEQTSTTENPTQEENTMDQQQLQHTDNVETQQATATTSVVYELEDGIPMPEIVQTRKPRESTMPLERMNVGQSFLVPFKEGEDVHKGRKRVSATVSQTRKRKLGADSSAQFITVIVEDGYRVWRKA